MVFQISEHLGELLAPITKTITKATTRTRNATSAPQKDAFGRSPPSSSSS